jgi:hypothetical protein
MPDPARVMFYDTVAVSAHLTMNFAQWAYSTVPDRHEHIANCMSEICPSLKEATVEATDAPDNQPGRTRFWKMSIYRSSFISVRKSMKIAIHIFTEGQTERGLSVISKLDRFFHTSSQPTTLRAGLEPAPTGQQLSLTQLNQYL